VSGPRRSRIVAAYLRTRFDAVRIRDRQTLEAHQRRLWRRLSPSLARTPALAEWAGRPLDQFPIVSPATMRADIAAWNSLSLTAEQATAAAGAAETGRDHALPHGAQAGFSTGGNGGERGLFITTPSEREDYLGALLGKLVEPARLLRPLRAALILRANNRLYQDIGGAGAAFLFLGLGQGPDDHLQALEAFAPTHLVAPPHVLADLARRMEEDGKRLKLDGLFYGAEPIGELESAWLSEVYGLVPRPLYQATEGFLGAPCPHGTLHLNEDGLVVELEPLSAGRFTPVVTDLRRRGQPIVRVRLDDLIEPLDQACPCGSPRLAIRPVEGRASDVWRFGDVAIFPREIEVSLERALGPRAIWSARAGPDGARIEVAATDDQWPAIAAVETLLGERGVAAPVIAQVGRDFTAGPKRRRVRWTP
jgi:putative adenylate-forming enzyme